MQSDLTELCVRLCSVPSVTGHEEQLADWISEELSKTALTLERHHNTVLARGPCRDKPLVALVGHSDTVPPSPRDQGVTQRQGRIYARGASDMKSGLAVMLALAQDLNLEELPVDLAWVIYDGEEGPIVGNALGPLLNTVPWLHDIDLALVMEPSDNVVQVGAMGTLHARLTFQGRSAHSARPWQGENAIHKAGDLLAQLNQAGPIETSANGFAFREVMSVTLASGGHTRNVIPDTFVLNLNYRFSPATSPEQAQDRVQQLVHNMDCDVHFDEVAPSGLVIDPDHGLYRRFLDLTECRVEAKQAWTDVSQLSRAGIDAINFGPGNSAQAHQAGEYVDISLMEQSYTLLRRFLEQA